MSKIIAVTSDASSSPPSRGAWIEIDIETSKLPEQDVAPLAGGVDGNMYTSSDKLNNGDVAPLAGGVD